MISTGDGRSKPMGLQVRSVHGTSAKRGGDGAPEVEPCDRGSRRETCSTGLGSTGGKGRAWRRRAPVARDRRESHDHPARTAGTGRRGPDSGGPPSQTWRWPDAPGKKRPELTKRLHEVMEDATAGDPM